MLENARDTNKYESLFDYVTKSDCEFGKLDSYFDDQSNEIAYNQKIETKTEDHTPGKSCFGGNVTPIGENSLFNILNYRKKSSDHSMIKNELESDDRRL